MKTKIEKKPLKSMKEVNEKLFEFMGGNPYTIALGKRMGEIRRLDGLNKRLLAALKQVSLYAAINHDKPKDYGRIADQAISQAEASRPSHRPS